MIFIEEDEEIRTDNDVRCVGPQYLYGALNQ